MQLQNLKDEYAALQKEVASKSQEKDALAKEVAEKEAALQKCQEDQEVVKQRLGQ